MKFKIALLLLMLSGLAPLTGQAQGTTVDGLRGAEWATITPTSVPFNRTPSSGFVGYSEFVAFDIYFRADTTHVYGLLEAKPAGQGLDQWSSALFFANLYFDTNRLTSAGSDVGIELFNNRAFVPGAPGYYNGLQSLGLQWATSGARDYGQASPGGTIEFSLPWNYFTDDPQGLGFSKISETNPLLTFRSVQAFGYTFIGSTQVFGDDRFGDVQYTAVTTPVPEPSTYGLCSALALLGLGLARRRRR